MHDQGEKTVLGHKSKQAAALRTASRSSTFWPSHPSTARFIATKLVRRFVSDTPPQALVDRVAATYTKTDGDIREMLRVILLSPEFSSSENVAGKNKIAF